jgi:hypothetical protein
MHKSKLPLNAIASPFKAIELADIVTVNRTGCILTARFSNTANGDSKQGKTLQARAIQ